MAISLPDMAKEFFTIAASKDVLGYIDEAGRKAGFARGQAFEDFLLMYRCNLAGATMEEEYLKAVHKGYQKGKPGARGIDAMTRAGQAVTAFMKENDEDILGDIFQGGITYGEGGQYFTPESVVKLMASLTIGDVEDDQGRKTVCDPACGSGRFLLAVGAKYPHWEYTGQDADHRCVQMSAINMGLRGLFGYAVWQNTLTLEVHRVYKIGLHFRGPRPGVIRDLPVEQSPFNYAKTKNRPPESPSESDEPPLSMPEADSGGQLDLF